MDCVIVNAEGMIYAGFQEGKPVWHRSEIAAPASPAATPRTDVTDDALGNPLGTVYLLKFPAGAQEHEFVSAYSYHTLERESAALRTENAELREKCRREWDLRIVAERQRGEARQLLTDLILICRHEGISGGTLNKAQAHVDAALKENGNG